jgi:hypothetical protein
MKRYVCSTFLVIVIVFLAATTLFYSNTFHNDQIAGTFAAMAQQENKSNASSNLKILNNVTIQNATDPGLGIDPNTNDIVAVFHRVGNDSTNLLMIQSQDNGSTFSEPVQVNSEDGDADPAYISPPIRFGPDGEIYVSWGKIVPHETFWGVGDIRLARSIDGGKSFEPTIYPAKDEPISEKLYADLAISKNGTILIPYVNNELIQVNESSIAYKMDEIDYITQMHVLRSNDDGKSFQKITLDNEGCQCCDTATAVGPDNEVYIAYRDSERNKIQPDDYSNKYITNKSDSEYVDKTALEQGLIEVPIYSTVRDIVISHTTDSGEGLKYSEPVKVQALEWYMNGCPSVGAGMQFDKSGVMHVGYFTGNGTNGAGYYYVNSEDNGQTFNKSIPLYTAEFVPPSHINMDLAIDKDNNIWIAYVTLPELEEHSGGHEEEVSKTLNIISLDPNGKLLGNMTFPSKIGSAPSNPSLIAVSNGVMLGYSSNNNFNMLTLSAS